MPYYPRATGMDMNGDGQLDLVALSHNGWPDVGGTGNTVDVFLGLDDGGLSAPTQYGGTDGQGFVVADLNGDGFPDVAASAWGVVGVFLNLGDGRLGPATPYATAPLVQGMWSYVSLGAGDVNADGRTDLVVSYVPYQEPPSALLLLLNLGEGMFAAPQILLTDTDRSYGAPVVSDLNGDGLVDIAVGSSDGVVSILLMQADGGFELTRYEPPPSSIGGAIAIIPRADHAPDLAFRLFNYASLRSIGVTILGNRGDGHFSDAGFYPTTNCANTILVADLNADCIPDVVTTGMEECGSEPNDQAASVMYGLPNGGFADPLFLQAGGTVSHSLALLGPVGLPRALAILDEGSGFGLDDGGWYSDGGIFILGNSSNP